jgi:hypothetical protein
LVRGNSNPVPEMKLGHCLNDPPSCMVTIVLSIVAPRLVKEPRASGQGITFAVERPEGEGQVRRAVAAVLSCLCDVIIDAACTDVRASWAG